MSQASDNLPLDAPASEKVINNPELLLGLPDEPTLAILSLLPLQQLIVNVPLVHPRLVPIRENVLKDTQRLVLHIGYQKWSKEVWFGSRFAWRAFSRNTQNRNTEPLCSDAYWSELDQLYLTTLDFRAVEQLSTLMPGIVHLKVAISHACVSILPQLIDLLSHWAPTLQTLKLHVGSMFLINSHWRLLPLAIDRNLVALYDGTLDFGNFWARQHLTLDVGKSPNDAQFANEFLFGDQTGDPLNLSTLIKEFYMHLAKCENGETFLFEALKNHVSEKWTIIGLNGVSYENLQDLANSFSFMTARKPEILTALPDVPTLAILSLLPLQQLFNLPLVHPRLAPFRQSVFKKNQRLVLHLGNKKKIKKRLLKSPLRLPFASHLVDSTGALLYPEIDTHIYTLHLATLDDHWVEQLTSLMPGIVHLQVLISHASSSVLPQLTNLLANWAPSLQTLHLTFGTFIFDSLTTVSQRKAESLTIISNLNLLIQDINSKDTNSTDINSKDISSKFGALQHLTLDIGNVIGRDSDELFSEDQTGSLQNLSILGQLREFYLHLGDCHKAPNFFLDQLEKYATEKLTKIGLGGDFKWNLNEMARSQFATRFTIVPFNHSPFLPSFTSLTVYGFDWQQLNDIDLVARLRALSSLSQLQCLKIFNFSPVSKLRAVSFANLPSLSSVTVLEMNISLEDNGDHNHLQAPFWEALFPSVQIAKVNHCGYFCASCYPGHYNARREIKNYASRTPCLKQLFAPLRGLPSLRKIFYQRYAPSFKYLKVIRLEKFDFIIAEFTPQGEFVHTKEYIC